MSDTQLPAALLALFGLAVAFYLYFLPTFIAYRRRARARGWILLFNIFAAPTIILWFALLFWAYSAEVKEQSPGHQSLRAGSVKLDAFFELQPHRGETPREPEWRAYDPQPERAA